MTENWIAKQMHEAKEMCERIPWLKSSIEAMKRAQERTRSEEETIVG